MSVSSHDPLGRRIQAALERAESEFHSNPAIPHRSRHLAHAALDACHAEEMLGALRLLVAAKEEKEQFGATPHYESLRAEGWKAARVLVAKLSEPE